jgi:hypothetical protein
MKKSSTQLKISARNAGEVELKRYCARCCWYLLRLKNMPFRIGMPGIMFHLEAIQKAYILARLLEDSELPRQFGPFSKCTEPVQFPFSFFHEHKKTGVLVTAQPDMMLRKEDGNICLLDLKTSKPDGGGKVWLPQYEIQCIGYSWVTEQNGIGKVGTAGLVYCSVRDDEFKADPLKFKTGHGIVVPFDFEPHEVELDYPRFFKCLEEVNKVWKSDRPPAGTIGCEDCALLTRLCDFESQLRDTDQRFISAFPEQAHAVIQQDFFRRQTRRGYEIGLQDLLSEDAWDQEGGMWANWQFS